MTRIRKRRMNITVATSEVVLVRRNESAAIEAFCNGCNTLVEWVNFDLARQRLDLPARILFRLVDLDQIHFRETAGGLPLFCSASLAAASDFRL